MTDSSLSVWQNDSFHTTVFTRTILIEAWSSRNFTVRVTRLSVWNNHVDSPVLGCLFATALSLSLSLSLLSHLQSIDDTPARLFPRFESSTGSRSEQMLPFTGYDRPLVTCVPSLEYLLATKCVLWILSHALRRNLQIFCSNKYKLKPHSTVNRFNSWYHQLPWTMTR